MILEQFIAGFPVYIAIPLLIFIMYHINATNSLLLGGFVAVLPRSLQLFGNIHSLSLYNSKILFMRAKYKNLKHFFATLKPQNLFEQIKQDELIILNTQTQATIPLHDLIDLIKYNTLENGRICIRGTNGAGKSSLLKILKQASGVNSILLMPGVRFNDPGTDASTGEEQLAQLAEIIELKPKKLFLDEWDANLDSKNLHKINLLLNEIAKEILIIEIRHGK